MKEQTSNKEVVELKSWIKFIFSGWFSLSVALTGIIYIAVIAYTGFIVPVWMQAVWVALVVAQNHSLSLWPSKVLNDLKEKLNEQN